MVVIAVSVVIIARLWEELSREYEERTQTHISPFQGDVRYRS
jgi:hypothetical protein